MYYEVFIYKQGGRATLDEAMLILASVLQEKPENESWANELWDQIDSYQKPPVVVCNFHDGEEPFDKNTLVPLSSKAWGFAATKDDLWDTTILATPTGERFACVIGLKSPKCPHLAELLSHRGGPKVFGSLEVSAREFHGRTT